jgi:hypothetical protein
MSASIAIAELELRGNHRIALQQALESLTNIAEPVGIVVSGSIIRGNPGPSSDLDIVVLHDQPWRRRVQRLFNGTPTELFFNTQEWLEHDIHDQAAHARPVMAHMLATGILVKDSENRMAGLIRAAQEVLAQGPGLKPAVLLRERYLAACLVEDALDFEGKDTADARQLLALAVDALAKQAYIQANRHLPRLKERLELLATFAPDLAQLLSRALREAPADAMGALRLASERALGVSGFFEWDSGPDDSAPPKPQVARRQ